MQKISPHLWFNKEAKEAAAFYASVFPNSAVTSVTTLEGTPSGTVDLVSFQVLGSSFLAISAGPFFTLNPSISFLVSCRAAEEVEEYWQKLASGGKPLMELGEYPFSKKYGWIQDRFGVSWQLMQMPENAPSSGIVPTLMFIGKNAGKAEEAMNFYLSIFPHARIEHIDRYGEGETLDAPGTIRHAGFVLADLPFAIMDSAYAHNFALNEAVSFIIHCENQAEIDYYWEKLSAVPEAEQCGWLKDKYGVSWQVTPTIMDEMLRTSDQERRARVTQAFLQMKKFDIATLQKAFDEA